MPNIRSSKLTRQFWQHIRDRVAEAANLQHLRAVVEHKGTWNTGRGFWSQVLLPVCVAAGTSTTRLCNFVPRLVTRVSGGGVQAVKTEKPSKVVCRGLRLERTLLTRIELAAKQGGFGNLSAFMRAALERELSGRESALEDTERRIAASLDQVARELRSVRSSGSRLSSHSSMLWSRPC